MRHRISYAVIVLSLFAVAADCFAQPSGGAKTATTGGTITGRVVDSAGEPLAGASITAGRVLINASRQTTSSDSKGEFKLNGLEAGIYSVFASLPGYVTILRSTDAPNFYSPGDSVTFTMSKGGVITGTVVGRDGPLVGVGVFASRVRDADGKKLQTGFPGGFERRTDDRGVFRMYGLMPGAYILMATRPRLGTVMPSAYDLDVPTFYPSGTRDTAVEILVHEGDEITADIQYRGEAGHAISGKLSGVIAEDPNRFGPSPQILLIDVRDRTPIASGSTVLNDSSVFTLYGVPDGEYELSAWHSTGVPNEMNRSPLQRVSVRGADVTGLNLKLEPLASIAGRLVFENDSKASCGKKKESAAPETIVYARMVVPAKKTESKADQPQILPGPGPYSTVAVADAKGSFTARSLAPGDYLIDPRLPATGWYISAVTRGPVQTRTTSVNRLTTTREDITLRIGEHLTGVTVTIAEGGAMLRGRVRAENSEGLPRLRVYLVPAEAGAAGNPYRFYETAAEGDGAFTVDNIAPGNYFIVAQRPEETAIGVTKLVRQDEALRTTILKDADALKKFVSLKPCEQLANFDLLYAAPR